MGEESFEEPLCVSRKCAPLLTMRVSALPGVEKTWNEGLNVWMRSPFCSICAFILIASIFNHPEIFVSDLQRFAQFVNGVHAYWNGQFFMSRTVEARTKFALARKAANEGPPAPPGFLADGKPSMKDGKKIGEEML